ncbi:endonuclease III [Desulfoscipio gibsoniae DSM 7213]|uniref:Endonuclease III n=1 Tax=Desulfoscipio gibsoniae DSM 7213 TaxID=767817 RepID=R4KGX4_9FIRM|nr:endonuclease III [Desulfoscipio gibsoniae DSM 7213]
MHFRNPFELLIAVILSAQCTDKQVNKTTAGLFEKYKTPQDFAVLSQQQLADEIKGCGLYRNKSLHIIKTCKILSERYGGRVPDNLVDLEALPGVGRKTANVVLNLAFGKPTFPVDTHVYRVARRLGLSFGNTPRRVERDLTDLIPEAERGIWHHRLIHFGRSCCTARNPICIDCVVAQYCPKAKKQTQTLSKEN